MSETKPNIRTGKLFEAGEYLDRGITVSPAQLRKAAADFKGPMQLNLQHSPSVLDGQLGTLDSVTVSDDGRELFGTVTEKAWLATVLGNTARRVSLEWDIATKKITGIALVIMGRVPDAVLFAAFSDLQQGKPVAPLVDHEAIDWNAVDEALAQSGLPPAKRPVAAFSGAAAGPDDIDWQQVEAACASFTAWKPGN